MTQPTTELTQEQIEFYEREGYLSIEALTTQEEVAWLREIYDRLFSERVGREEGNQFDLAGTDEEGKEASLPQILNPSKYAPELNDSQLLKNATTISKQLRGEEATCRFAHAIFKPARSGAETPWHQDAAYWGPNLIYSGFSIWVPLQEATPENGCMEFVPGSHKLDVVEHQSINNDPRIHGLELTPEQMDKIDNVATCPLPAGGATLHGGYMMHHTGANRSDVPRRAIILSCSAPRVPREVPRTFPWNEAKKTARAERAIRAKA